MRDTTIGHQKISALLLMALLAGCGGGGGAVGGTASNTAAPTAASDPVSYTNAVLGPGYQTDLDTLVGDPFDGTTGTPNSAFKAIPTSGTATYAGFALIGINRANTLPGAPRLTIEGTSTLAADFGAGSITGSATNFVGEPTGDQNTTTGKFPALAAPTYFPGTISMTGCIGTQNGCSATRPNQVAVTYTGQLSNGTYAVSTSGSTTGDFKGTPIKGIAITDGGATYIVNGTAEPGVLAVLAKP
ncbi:MAG: hypothetical protein KGI94_07385 [Paracoccaceae bacterium]|nr:hypothetical protein [Paracoccaceae bacterium]MDE3121972.1 hypothetical protein [Paracoccaceae bacterium]MDE3238592.1 hypothetical protein [Paracoccaceae bacterium]